MNLLQNPNKRRWYIVATIFVAIICNYLDRQLLSILKPEILTHFGIEDLQYAWIVNVFLICYAIMYPISGILVDRFGSKKVMLGGIVAWSLACIGGGLSTNVVEFTICRGILGLAEPTIFAGQLVAVTLWFEKRQRATANSLCTVGGSLGAVIAPLVIAWLMRWFSNWQEVFLVAGVAGLVIAGLWMVVYRTPSQEILDRTVNVDRMTSSGEEQKSFTLGGLFRTRTLWGAFLIRLISDPVWYFCCFWLPGYLRGMGQVAKEERAAVGKAVNEVRGAVEAALEERKRALATKELEAAIDAAAVDVTLPGRGQQVGTRHLINAITDQISEIFLGLGYTVAQGPEVETDYYNFEALNAPADHPSRSMQDTFYVVDRSGEESAVRGESKVLLRTQTSGVQVHVMEQQEPPIYIIAPGKVYRRDVADPSHLPQFTQIEGLVVDKGITFGDLKGTLDYFCKQMFGPDRKTRFRAHYFPFTEPSAEADVSCGVCGGTGHLHDGERCRMCKGTGWLEILGCGMVDPNVLSMSGIDPEEYSGFAFGVGVERVACLKYNVPDLRMLLEGDMRFLRQF